MLPIIHESCGVSDLSFLQYLLLPAVFLWAYAFSTRVSHQIIYCCISLRLCRNLSQWSFIIGNRFSLCQHVLASVTTKSFEILGWNEDTGSCDRGTILPTTFYVSLLSFWRTCLEFHWNEHDVIHLSEGLYSYTDIPLGQKEAMIRFSLSAAEFIQSTWSTSLDKEAKQTVTKFFKQFTSVISFCLGKLQPNYQISLDSTGEI